MSSSTPTSPITPRATLPSTYATLSLHKTDTLRLLNFPATLPAELEPVFLSSWQQGLESQSRLDQSYEFKFKGRPFGYFRSVHHVGGIRLMRDVLAFLHARGWILLTSMLCSRRYTAKDTLVFRRRGGAEEGTGTLPPAETEWLGLAPLGTDRLRVVYDAADAAAGDGKAEKDHDHLGVLITAVKGVLQELGYFEKGEWNHDSFEFALKGHPWQSRGEASVKKRIMLMRLLETMDERGWRLYATIIQRRGNDESRVMDTWYFVREREKAREVVSGEAALVNSRLW